MTAAHSVLSNWQLGQCPGEDQIRGVRKPEAERAIREFEIALSGGGQAESARELPRLQRARRVAQHPVALQALG
jgi:hypothetical protein